MRNVKLKHGSIIAQTRGSSAYENAKLCRARNNEPPTSQIPFAPSTNTEIVPKFSGTVSSIDHYD
ncbi:hypothetical protein WAI453_005157 [Rhynchosporium graminicola]